MLLGVSCLFFAIAFTVMEIVGATDSHDWFTWTPAVFSFLVAVACVPGRHVAVIVRIVAAMVFSASVWYLLCEIMHPCVGDLCGGQSLQNSVMFMFVFGLPSLYVMVYGTYPRWGVHQGVAEEFNEPKDDIE